MLLFELVAIVGSVCMCVHLYIHVNVQVVIITT